MSLEPSQQNPPYPPTHYAPVPQPPVYYHPESAPMPVPTSGWAIASLVCSLVGAPLLGIIFGYIAIGEVRNSLGCITGAGMAKAGMIIGLVEMALAVVLIVVWVVLFFVVTSSPSSYVG